MSHQFLIGVLSVTIWWLFGLSYMAVSSRYWPRYESMRGKWTPGDALEYIMSRKDMPPISRETAWVVPFVVSFVFVFYLSIWPVTIYWHAKRGFKPEKDNP